jgi:hypothetical protein
VFLFLEAAMMPRTREAKDRVAINKLLNWNDIELS